MDPGYSLSLAVIAESRVGDADYLARNSELSQGSIYSLLGRRSQASNNAAPTSAVTTQN
jgi:hypothetical protein